MFSSSIHLASIVPLLSLFLAQGIVSTSTTQHSGFDITKTLNDTLVETCRDTVNYHTTRILSDKIKYHRSTFEIENTLKLEPFVGDKIYLHNIEVRAITYNKPIESPVQFINPSMYYNYDTNKMGLISSNISFKIYGYIGVEPKNTYVGFRATLEYEDIEISVTKNGEKLKLQIDGDIVKNRVRLQYWNTEANDTTNTTSTSTTPYNVLEDLIKEIDPLSKSRIPYIVRKTLTNRTKSLMPSILLDNMNRNKEFIHAMNVSFHLQPKQKIISQYPDLLNNEQQYYFSIANFSILDLNLENMKIRGLWNYRMLFVKPFEYRRDNYTVSALGLKNISGSVHWNHGYKNVSPLDIYFKAGNISIMYDHKEKFIVVQLLNYGVTEISPKLVKWCDLSILSRNTKPLIEIAITSKILPSVENIVKHDLEKYLTNVRNELVNWFRKTFPETSKQQSDHKTPKQIHQVTSSSVPLNDTNIQSTSISSNDTTVETSIPFNNNIEESTFLPLNETNTKSASIPSNHTTVKSLIPNNKTKVEEKSNPESYNYQISFPNVTIKLVSANAYTTDQLQCQIFNNNEFTRQINAVMVGALHLNSKRNNSIALNFHCNFNSMNFSIIKPNGSDKNDTCEFQISNNQDIKVELPPLKNCTTRTKESREIKKKIDETLLSMVTQRISRNMKSLACFPVDVCTQSVKMIDHYVLGFVDNVLKKCSFRRNKTTIT